MGIIPSNRKKICRTRTIQQGIFTYNAFMRAFLDELRRRKVHRVAIAYLVGAWLVLQTSDIILPAMGLPVESISLVLGLLVLGFPLALVLSWFFDFKTSGIELTNDTVSEQPAVEESTPSVAVLPFADMSPDHDNEYFADGLTEELLNVLSKAGGMRVASRTSSYAFKGKNADIKTVATKLNVAHVIEGSVRKSGNLLRITSQLIEVATDSHIWSETYDRELNDIFAIQDEIATQIANALRVQLTPQKLTQCTTENVRAYDYFLRGRSYFNTFGQKNVWLAIEMYETAAESDPTFARAWAGIAISKATLAMVFMVDNDDRKATIDAAREAAKRSIELAPELADSH
jgi:adenylate cyclase